MKNFITLILFACPLVLHAQFKDNVAAQRNYLNKANVLNYEKKTDSALVYYELAVNSFPDFKLAWLQIADAYMTKGAFTKAANAYTQAILRGSITNTVADLVLDYNSYKTQPDIVAFAAGFDSIKKVFYGQHFDLRFDRFIGSLATKDLYARALFTKYLAQDSAIADMQWEQNARMDTTENLRALLSYIDNNGFPQLSTLDDEARNNMWLAIHHILQYPDNQDVHRLEHIVQDAVYSGNYIVQDYLMSLDYRYVHEKKKQLYGTYKQRKGTLITFAPAIDDVATVDERRNKWLLLSLKMAAQVEEAPNMVTAFPDGYEGK